MNKSKNAKDSDIGRCYLFEMEYLLYVGTLAANVSKLVAFVAALILVRAQASQNGLPILVFADITCVIM